MPHISHIQFCQLNQMLVGTRDVTLSMCHCPSFLIIGDISDLLRLLLFPYIQLRDELSELF